MAKIVIFKKNSPWGILKIPLKGNLYKHVIDFVNPRTGNFNQALKDEFVDNELCDYGINLAQMLAESKETGWKPLDELRFIFTADVESQNNRMNINDLANSDICVKNENGKNLFYTLKIIKRDVGMLHFEAELDIFFSYNITFRTGTKNNVLQGHITRWNNTKALLPEKIDFTPTVEKYEKIDWHVLNTKNDDLAVEIYKKIKWLILYEKGVGHTTNQWGNDPRRVAYEYEIPYNIWILPLHSEYNIEWDPIGLGARELNLFYVKKLVIDNDRIISTHILDEAPLRFDLVFAGKFTADKTQKKLTFEGELPDGLRWHQNVFKFTKLNELNSNFLKKTGATKIKTKFYLPANDWKLKLTIMENEGKLLFWQYFYLTIKKWNSNSQKYYPYFLDASRGWHHIESYYTFQPEMFSQLIYFKGKTNFVDNWLAGNVLDFNTPQEMPTSQTAYLDFMRQNRNQIQTGIKYDKMAQNMAIGSGVIGMVGSTIGGIATGNPLAGAGVIGSALSMTSGIISSQKSLEMRDSKLADIQNILPSVNSSNNLLFQLLINRNNNENFKVITHDLMRYQKLVLFDNFTAYGYNLNYFEFMGLFKDSRYRFNYIQATDIFNSISTKLSPLIKEKIASAYADGLTIWHYRDKNTWNGILNYNHENWEVNELMAQGLI